MKYLHFSFPKKKPYPQSRTVAAIPLSAPTVVNLAKEFIDVFYKQPNPSHVMVGLNVGVAKLHPHDQYSKKNGRDAAVANIKNTLLRIIYVSVSSTHIFIELEKYQGVSLYLRLNLRTGFSTVTGDIS